MTLSNLEGLAARDAWLYVAHAWPALQARLVPGDGAPGAGTGETARLPIDVAVSDLMREIEEHARFYGQVLLEETTDWAPRTSTMPGLLVDVATRYGHFTMAEDRIALDFADAAHEAQRKVHGALERPAPPRWVGPCPDEACEGSLRQREDQVDARCRTCGREVGPLEWQALMYDAFEERVMTRSELESALLVTGHQVKIRTIDQWITRRRLVEVGDTRDRLGNRVGLFRFRDAWSLAEGSPTHARRAMEGSAA